MRTCLLHGCTWVSALLWALAGGGQRVMGSPTSTTPAVSTLAQNAPAAGPPQCQSSDIENKKVVNCDCPSKFPDRTKHPWGCLNTAAKQCSQSCKVPKPTTVASKANMVQCGKGCVEANDNCNPCYLWFSGLCNCMKEIEKGGKTNCIPSKNPFPQNEPVWMVNGDHSIITTSVRVPGILELHQNMKSTDIKDGFEFAQAQLQTLGYGQHGTLAINSVADRDQEQIHIHLCDNKNTRLRNALSGQQLPQYKTLKTVVLGGPLAGWKMSCRAAQKKGAKIDPGEDIATAVEPLIHKDDCARYHVGAGLMIDSRGHAWSCVTTQGNAEVLFCKS